MGDLSFNLMGVMLNGTQIIARSEAELYLKLPKGTGVSYRIDATVRDGDAFSIGDALANAGCSVTYYKKT